MDPHVFEQGDRYYFVAPVGMFTPSANEIQEFAFAQELAKGAPNPNLVWMRGQYVEADKPNRNKQQWTADEIAIKRLTPMYMPVTVMHDEATAVGLIADVALRTPEKDSIPRAKLETALALWGHRFPDIVHEAQENARLGTLMQSMEAISPDYSCSECGMTFHKLPGGGEREQWCDHLSRMDGEKAARILGNVVFTGTGLIFGTRGAEGADPNAHLEVFQQEIAEFHEKAHRDTARTTRRKRTHKMETVEVAKTEYDRLNETARDHDELATKLRDAEKEQERLESELKKVSDEKADLETKVQAAEEKARQDELGKQRVGELGDGFLAKLGDKTKARLEAQAKTMQDEEWSSRLEELEEITEVSRDSKADEDDESEEAKKKKKDKKDGEFSKDEIASFQGKGGKPGDGEVSPAARRSVIGTLAKL